MKVATAVRRELRALREIDAQAAGSALAATAVVLAQELDAPGEVECRECGATVYVRGISGSTKANLARALGEVLRQLRGSRPGSGTTGPIDDLTARRDARLAGRPAP